MGLAFDFDESQYIESNKFFVSASEEYKETELKSDLNETIVRGNVTHDLFGDLTQDIPWERMWLSVHTQWVQKIKTKCNRYSYICCFGVEKCLKVAMYIVQNYCNQKMINV